MDSTISSFIIATLYFTGLITLFCLLLVHTFLEVRKHEKISLILVSVGF